MLRPSLTPYRGLYYPRLSGKIKNLFHTEYKNRGWGAVETVTPAKVGNVFQGLYQRGSEMVVVYTMDSAAAKSIGLTYTVPLCQYSYGWS
jgi:hypothetical protein